jgi:hypothetical protein
MYGVKTGHAKAFPTALAAMILLPFFTDFASYQNDHVRRAIIFEQVSQYFSIMKTRLLHVEQYFGSISLGLCTKGLSAILHFTIRLPAPDKRNYK